MFGEDVFVAKEKKVTQNFPIVIKSTTGVHTNF